MDEFFAHHAAPRWGRRGTSHELRRAVSRHGVCAVDLARVLARHRDDVGSERRQALFDGFAPQRSPLHLGRRKRHDAKLFGAVHAAYPGVSTVALHDTRKARPWNKLHELRKQRLADIHGQAPRASILGSYTKKAKRVSNRHQIKSASRPRQHWISHEFRLN